MRPLTANDRERFWSRVKQGPGCWEWQAGTYNTTGYGQFWVRSRRLRARAHRIAYELSTGAHPGEMLVCHTCDNRTCVRPDHLFIGTHADNARDRNAKNRQARGRRNGAYTQPGSRRRGSRNGRAKLTEDQVVRMRGEINGGMSLSEAARRYGVTVQVVWEIHHRKIWRHV